MKKTISILMFLMVMISLIPGRAAEAAPDPQGTPTTIEIQPGPANVDDVVMRSDTPTGNYPYDILAAGENNTPSVISTYRSLISFDMSGVPYDMNVQSASLELTLDSVYATSACDLELYAVKKDWHETSAHWNEANGFYSPWQTPGATGPEDVTEIIGTGFVDTSAVAGDKVTITFTDPSYIEEFRRDNYSGMFFKCAVESDNLYIFESSDTASVATDRPKLIISYLPDGNNVDLTSWRCVENSGSSCETNPLSQYPNYTYTGSDGRAPGIGMRINAVKIDCNPYPRCINDYAVHYFVRWHVVWAGANSTASVNLWLDVPGYGDIPLESDIPCGENLNNGECYGTFDGTIQTDYLPRFYDGGYNIGVNWVMDTHLTSITSRYIEYEIFYSLEPFDQNCADLYAVNAPATFPIDPAIEAPVGTPTDEQVYTTEIGKTYMFYVSNEWYDEAHRDPENPLVPLKKNDTAISFDGVNWMNWQAFMYYAECLDVEPGRADDVDLKVVYFIAQTTTIYVRADDVEGEFADNLTDTINPLLHFEYTIGEATLLASDCDSQFSYDPEGDLFASVDVVGTAEDNPVNATFETGEWYGVKVMSGTWSDPGGDSRTDMQFRFDEWAPLAVGENYVWCAGNDVIYIQAPSADLSLRVNDLDNNFSNNSGTLNVNIYHVTYTYTPADCAADYEVDTIVASGTVGGGQTNGTSFANSLLNPVINTSYAVTPGAFYMLETRDGPWYLRDSMSSVSGEYQPGNNYYDVQLRSVVSNAESEWVAPDAWSLSVCVVETDALGHLRIYFQVPNNNNGDLNQGGAEYFIRVAGAGLLGMGSIGWDLYQAYEGPTEGGGTTNPWEDCEKTYVNTSSLPLNSTAWIPVKDDAGTAVVQYGATGGGATVLTTDEDYWIRTSNGPWYDGAGGVEPGEGDNSSNAGGKYTAQLSSDGGATWYDFADHPAVYCSNVDQLGSYETAFFHVSVGQVWKIRVNDVETNLWTDNSGTLAYSLYALNPVGFPVTAGDVTDANFEVCAPILIKPYIPGMIFSKPSMASVSTPSSWDVSDWVSYLGDWFAALGSYIGDVAEIAVNNTGVFFQGFGTYVGDWATYLNRSFISFFAWCPRHVNILLATINQLQDKEPVATIMELKDAGNTAYAEVESYDWGVAGEGGGIGSNDQGYIGLFSLGEGGGAGDSPDTTDYIFERIFPTGGPGWSVWSGEGDIVVFGDASLPDYYYTCNDVFGDFLPERLRQGVCFTSAHWRETGAWWWVQLSIDVSTIFMLIGMIKSSAQSLIYMMTGVRPWTKDGAIKLIGNVAMGDITQDSENRRTVEGIIDAYRRRGYK